MVVPALVRTPAELAQLRATLEAIEESIEAATNADGDTPRTRVIVVDDGSDVAFDVSDLTSDGDCDGVNGDGGGSGSGSGSGNGSSSVNGSVQRRARCDVAVLRHASNLGPAAARNSGMEAAFGASEGDAGASWVAFCDADAQPEVGWFAAMAYGQRERPGVLCGLVRSADDPHDGLIARAVAAYHDRLGTLNGRIALGEHETNGLLYGTTCNMSVHRALDLLFDPTFPHASYEDVEFCLRARKRNVGVHYLPTAVVRHHFDTSLQGFYRQYRRYGASEPLLNRIHPEFLSWRSVSEAISSR